MAKQNKKLVIIDSNALIHRAFHALPPLATKDGQIVNAVYGFALILLKIIKDLKPDYIAAAFDLPGGTFRHEEYAEYKATRTKQPDELYAQMPIVKELLGAFNVPIFEQKGYEADDIIGTIAHLKGVNRPGMESIIATGDQDILQLIDANTKVLSPHKGFSETIIYDEQGVKDKFDGLTPAQLIDYKGLRGDTSDNIPGVKGIGPKGATDLIKEFGTLEEIYEHLDSPKIKDRTRELLKQYKDDAFMSKRLATIVREVPIDFDLEKCAFTGFDKDKLIDLFQRLNFKKLLAQLGTIDQKAKSSGQAGLFDSLVEKKGEENVKPVQKNAGEQNYNLVNDKKSLAEFIKELKKQEEFCFDTETTGIDPFQAKLLGISFCWTKGLAYYVTVEMVAEEKDLLKKIFTDKKIRKIGHNLKYDIEILNNYFGVEVVGLYFDTMLGSYLLSPGNRQHGLDNLAFVELGYQMQPIEDLIGKGKNQLCLNEVPVEKVSWYSCEDADMTWRLYQKIKPEVDEQGMMGIFEKIDLPLVSVLAEVEKNGIKVDVKKLGKLSKDFEVRIKEIEKEAYKHAGEEFNLASPKQLKEILFGKLEISSAGIGKTKTGLSTAADELEKMAGLHPIIDLIIEFRELSKLKSTYLDSLPKMVNPNDGRVHTSFNQTVAATGRLSSSDPNLQNIPIRSGWGQKIREAFVADKGNKLIKADYSQIELRVVASLANDAKMLEAFESKTDIHTQTAAAINNVKLEDVTPDMRRQAKEVNFGVLYGMGSWGLSQRTGISTHEATMFIEKYFGTYKDLKKYLNETIEIARDRGYVETLYGRRRYLPEINSNMPQVKSGAERMAVNTPIQGTAADMIKLAMIEIAKELPKVSSEARMILQVHDELVFEVPEKEAEKVGKFIQKTMNEVVKLRAPIETEVGIGDNWGRMEKVKF